MTVEQPEGGRGELADLRAEVERLRSEVERYTAGADQSQPEPGVVPMPGQWWAHLLSLPEEARMEALHDAERRDEIAGKCRRESHTAEIAYLRESGSRMLAERDALQRHVDAVRALTMNADQPGRWVLPDDGDGPVVWVSAIEAALDAAVEPADQPHPTPEADGPLHAPSMAAARRAGVLDEPRAEAGS